MRQFVLVGVLALSACAAQVVDHSPVGNLLDAASASLDTDNGAWTPWYNTELTHNTDTTAVGSGSLRVLVTKAFGWGIQVDNFPGYAAHPGVYRAELWARARAGGSLQAAFVLGWRDADGHDLATSRVNTTVLDGTWEHFVLETQAPAGTTRLGVSVTGNTQDSGGELDFDELLVLPKP